MLSLHFKNTFRFELVVVLGALDADPIRMRFQNLGMRMFILQNLQVKDGVSSWKINIQAIAKHRADLLSYDFSGAIASCAPRQARRRLD